MSNQTTRTAAFSAAGIAALLVAAFALLTGGERAATLGLTRHGQLVTVQDAGAADAVATVAVSPGTAGQVLTVSDAGLPHWAAASGGTPWGATIVDPLTGGDWTETEAASTSATIGGGLATLTASSGATGRVEIQQPAPIPSTAQRWSYLARVDVTAGDITSSTGYVLLAARVDTSNYVYLRMRASDLTVVYAIGGSATTSTHTAPTDVQRTGGQLWLSLSGSAEGRWVARWGVGSAGAIPTVWTTLTILDVPALSAAVPATAGPELWVGSVGGAPLAATHTAEVLAFRSTWEGSL